MQRRQKALVTFVIVVIVSVAAGIFAYPPLMKKIDDDQWGRPYRFGLDIAGGSQLIYEVDMSQVDNDDRESVMNGLRDVIEKRVNLFGVSEPRVVAAQSEGNYRLVVELAGVRDVAAAIQEIGQTPLLDFREVSQIPADEVGGSNVVESEESTIVDGGEAEVPASEEGEPETTGESSDVPDEVGQPNMETVYIETELTGRYVNSASLGFDQTTGEPLVFLEFDDTGAQLFDEITGRNIGQPVAIFLDGEPISQPIVQQRISGGRAQITGRFTVEEARTLVERFNAGALPAPINLVSQQTVDAILGQEALNLGVLAGVVGLFAVMLFMMVYYGRLGIFASIALMMYIFLTLAVFKAIPVTLTLAGIAGFILTIGMAVDANVLIFERTTEELRRGATYNLAIEEGFRRAWPSIRDANLSTIITAIVLYFFTTSIVQGFALTLLVGVLMSMFSAITITRSMLRVFLRKS